MAGFRTYPGTKQLFVLFPDHGAYDRYKSSVEAGRMLAICSIFVCVCVCVCVRVCVCVCVYIHTYY